MLPEDDPKFEDESFPCNCGGEIKLDKEERYWECNKCNFKEMDNNLDLERN